MPIIIDAWLDRALRDHPVLRRWVWFVLIYAVSVAVFAAVAFGLNALVPG
ncbi:DUF2474 family protein [Acidiphilium sp. AL]|uniref:DUF2474 family protein n=1 Tax=Acidiphilium iwatense TaxID=768198 RepID=A0ABS9DUX6_9PROT|nr:MULTISPECIES: DUF2474 family protein [Acidiphilium]MCF3945933.1 DUF2474 family protein [Acidiphilium iwatense]MCU4159186.1 DUF2474 family protein [Acidiphilium sp. AL]